MSKEFHVFTHHDPQYEQAFVFEVERHEDDEFVEFKDLLMITTTSHGELRTRLQFEDMIQSIIHTHGGNVNDSSVNVIVDMFKDLIPKEKQQEIMEEMDDRKIRTINVDELIKASEYADIIEQAERVDNETNKGTTRET